MLVTVVSSVQAPAIKSDHSTWVQVVRNGRKQSRPQFRTSNNSERSWSIVKLRVVPLFETVTDGFNSDMVSDVVSYNRIVVVPSHFNKTKYRGFITMEEANTMRMAIGLSKELIHGVMFEKSSEGELMITYRLKSHVARQDMINQINF